MIRKSRLSDAVKRNWLFFVSFLLLASVLTAAATDAIQNRTSKAEAANVNPAYSPKAQASEVYNPHECRYSGT